ncbi:MAG: lyase family protein [Minisyncoccia bacterium]
MIDRYADSKIYKIWTDGEKLLLWKKTELAVIKAREKLGVFLEGIFDHIQKALQDSPIDFVWWKKREDEVHHDLNAFLDERRRFIPLEYQQYFHKNMTSYDTEESAFLRMLNSSFSVVEETGEDFITSLKERAVQHRYTVMFGRTHGQAAELQSFGKRCLTWLKAFEESWGELKHAEEKLRYSKISGAIGNYGGIDPVVEEHALKELGFKPFYGATQILPRENFLPLAGALLQVMLSLEKIALDIRLGARSGCPIYQEPFGKKQKGSSAMPHKKNTILTENVQGMARLARGYFDAIRENLVTWEERSIEQSSVERVAWPDLFHVVILSLKRMTKVLKGLVVYQDNMMKEIAESRGCYASNEAKELLKEIGVRFGIDGEIAYRIVQLAAFNVFEPSKNMKRIREAVNRSFEDADALLRSYEWPDEEEEEPRPISIEAAIMCAELEYTDQLDISEEEVSDWNDALRKIFSNSIPCEKWREIFTISHLLRYEDKLYEEILSV